MKPHIQQTIDEINCRILELQAVSVALQQLDREREGKLESYSAPAPATVKPRPATPSNVCRVQPATPALKSEPKKPSPHRVDSARVISAARKLAEPFNTKDLARNADITRNAAGGYLFRWKRAGWLTLLSRDSYRRTSTFGGPTEQSNALLEEIHRDIASVKQKED